MTINTKGKKVPLESAAAEFENVAVELQAVTGDLKEMLQTIEAFNEVERNSNDQGNEVSTESIMAFIKMTRSVKQARTLMAELERISAEANALMYVLDSQIA